MHVYSTDAKDRQSIPIWLAAMAVAATLSLNYVLKLLKMEVPWWVDSPSVMGFYGLFFQWFEQSGWSMRLGKIKLSSIPDLRGTWLGTIHSSYGGGTQVPGIMLHVRQTWLSISIKLETSTSSSYSIMAAVNAAESSQPGLKYEYLNEPSALSDQTMQAHRGTANLRLSPNGTTLAGDYFTGRGRLTIGTMDFKFISKEYLMREEAIRQAAGISSQP